jgi:hypothetical protein
LGGDKTANVQKLDTTSGQNKGLGNF